MGTDPVGSNANPPENLQWLGRNVEIPKGDLLHALVTTQAVFLRDLEDKYPERWGGRVVHLKEQVLMIVAEAVELLNWLPWKKHKENFDSPMTEEQKDAAIEEVVDLMHFVFNCFILLGVRDGLQIYQLYMAKHGVNQHRQRERY